MGEKKCKNKIGSNKKFGWKKGWVEKEFWSKKNLGQRNFLSEKKIGLKMVTQKMAIFVGCGIIVS